MFSWDSLLGRTKSGWETCLCRAQTIWESSPLRPNINRVIFFWRSGTKKCLLAVLFIAFIALPYLALKHTPATFQSILGTEGSDLKQVRRSEPPLWEILKAASMPNKTVILTVLNDAWAHNNSMIDLFLESFRLGDGIESLLNHLIIIAVDQKAYNRCVEIHTHCYMLKTEGVDFSGEKTYMSEDYLKMVWRRLEFMKNVLEKGYSFVFSDADILWFRNPFLHFFPEKDFQISCDKFNGNPTDLHNKANTGFIFARANNQVIKFYDYWYRSRESHPKIKEQDVLNDIKLEKMFLEFGVKVMFLDTQLFGGFCSISRSNFDKVIIMHANCCKGLTAKLKDLKSILADWKQYRSTDTSTNRTYLTLRAPTACRKSWH